MLGSSPVRLRHSGEVAPRPLTVLGRMGLVFAMLAAYLVVQVVTAPGSAPAHAAAPTPVPGTVIWTENYQGLAANSYAMQTAFNGSGGMTYTSDSIWTDIQQCNGVILNSSSPGQPMIDDNGWRWSGCPNGAGAWVTVGTGQDNVTPPVNQQFDSWENLKALSRVLGTLNGTADPRTNSVMADYTQNATVSANSLIAKTKTQITLPGATGRFVTFSVNVATTSCREAPAGSPWSGHQNDIEPQMQFNLLQGATVTPVTPTALNPCKTGTVTIAPSKTYNTSNGNYDDSTVKVASQKLVSSGSVLLNGGSTVGFELRSAVNVPNGVGFDTAIDDIQLLDVSPTLSKEFTPTAVGVNSPSKLVFTVTNTSELGAKAGFSFTDTLPTGLIVAPSPNYSTTCTNPVGAPAAGAGTISLKGDLSTGQSACTYSVDVVSATAGAYTNSASNITSSVGLNLPASPTTLNVLTNATIAKSFASSAISLGQTTTMTLTLGNSNSVAITGASFTDTYPSGMVNAGTPAVGGTCTTGSVTAVAGGSSLAWSGGTIPPGGCTITVAIVGNSIGNWTNTTGQVSTTNAGTGPSTGSATLAVANPMFTVAKTANKAAPIVGETVTYTVTVTNTGAGAGTATMSDVVPAGVTVTDATCAGTNGATCTVSRNNNSVSGTVTAPANGVVTFTVTGTAATAGGVTNTATVTATTPGCTQALCGGGSASTTITTGDKPVFAITKVADKSSHLVGEPVIYTVTVSNTGSGAGTASISDVVPTNVTVSSVSCAGTNGATCTSVNSAGTVTGTVTMPGNSTVKYTITGTAATAGGVTNTASVTPTTAGCSPNNQCGGGSAQVSTTIGDQPIFTQTKTVNDTSLLVGQPVTYTITVTNSGKASGTASVDDIVPNTIAVSGFSCSATAPAVCSTAGSSGNTLAGVVSSLPAGASATFTVSGKAATVGTGIVNTATVTPTTPGCTAGNCGGGPAVAPGVDIAPARSSPRPRRRTTTSTWRARPSPGPLSSRTPALPPARPLSATRSRPPSPSPRSPAPCPPPEVAPTPGPGTN